MPVRYVGDDSSEDSEPFSYEQASLLQLSLVLRDAWYGRELSPVYSGDMALAFRIRHRAIKDAIERCYGPLRTAYGARVHPIRAKRVGSARALNGYVLPFKALMQLLIEEVPEGEIVGQIPALLYVCLSNGAVRDGLN